MPKLLLTDRYLDEVSELACLDNPESYAGESLVLLVGPPKPDRSKDRGQTRYDPPPPPTCRFSIGLTTLSCKNAIVTETATNNLYNSRKRLSEGPQGACMNGSGESRKEATGKTKEVLNAKN